MKALPMHGKAIGIDIVLGFLFLWFASLLFRLHIPFAGTILTSLFLSIGKIFLNRYQEEVTHG